jgi:hypothetical protein
LTVSQKNTFKARKNSQEEGTLREDYLGLAGQHVVPQDGGPATRQLAAVGDDHDGQGDGLKRTRGQTKSKAN